MPSVARRGEAEVDHRPRGVRAARTRTAMSLLQAQPMSNNTRSQHKLSCTERCERFEVSHHCFIWQRSQMPYRKACVDRAEEALLRKLHDCSACGVRRHQVLSMAAGPPALPRNQLLTCSVEGDAPTAPISSRWLRHRRKQIARWLRLASCHCKCRALGNGVPVTFANRHFPRGLTELRGLCGLDGRARRIQLSQSPVGGGNNNLILRGWMANETSGADVLHGAAQPTTIVRVSSKPPVNRTWAPEQITPTFRCRLVGPEQQLPAACAERLTEVCSSLLASHSLLLELQGIPGWPEVYAVGCCAYQYNATHVAPLLLDARQELQMRPPEGVAGRRLADGADRPRERLITALLRSAAMLHMLTEHPYHVHLGEHVFGFSPQVTFKIGFQ